MKKYFLIVCCLCLSVDLFATNEKEEQKNTIYQKNFSSDFLDFDVKWPLIDDYELTFGGAYVSFVRKQWMTRTPGSRVPYNLWGNEGKWLNGLAFGAEYNSHYDWGLGIHTGFVMEMYASSADEDYSPYYDFYMEMSMYVPVHASFLIPFSEKSALQLRGGIGIDLGLYNEWMPRYENMGLESWYYTYGDDGFPNIFNLSYEYGVNLKIRRVMLGVTWSKGLLKNSKMYVYDNGESVDTRQNKISFHFTWIMDN